MKKHRQGFTIIEMMVATLLLAVGVAAALGTISSAVRLEKSAADQQTAAILAQKEFARIQNESSNTSQNNSGTPPTSGQGDFSPDHPDYRWSDQVGSTSFTDLYKVTLTISWGGQGTEEHSHDFTTYVRVPQQQSQSGTGTAGQTSGGTGASSP